MHSLPCSKEGDGVGVGVGTIDTEGHDAAGAAGTAGMPVTLTFMGS